MKYPVGMELEFRLSDGTWNHGIIKAHEARQLYRVFTNGTHYGLVPEAKLRPFYSEEESRQVVNELVAL